MAVVLAVVFLAGGVWAVAKPSLVVQLRPEGVRPAIGPVVPWAEVVDARVIDLGTTPMPAVTVAPAYVERDPGLTGWRRRGWNLTRSMYGPPSPCATRRPAATRRWSASSSSPVTGPRGADDRWPHERGQPGVPTGVATSRTARRHRCRRLPP